MKFPTKHTLISTEIEKTKRAIFDWHTCLYSMSGCGLKSIDCFSLIGKFKDINDNEVKIICWQDENLAIVRMKQLELQRQYWGKD